jgi:hypothetical protein
MAQETPEEGNSGSDVGEYGVERLPADPGKKEGEPQLRDSP